MQKTTRVFIILIVLFSIGIFLIFKGIQPQFLRIVQPTPRPSTITSSGSAIDTSSKSPESSTNEGSQQVKGEETQLYKVTKVVDGDTIEVDINGQFKKIRLIGINTPETIDPRRPVQCFGAEASHETKRLLEGKSVRLEKDVSETDKYGRLLRFVYLPLETNQWLLVNDYLVREGFAQNYTYPPDISKNEQFKQAETEARAVKKGLWGSCK